MKLNDLLEKYISVEYINFEENGKAVGKLVEIDEILKVIHVHVHHNNTEHLIPLYCVKSIKESY